MKNSLKCLILLTMTTSHSFTAEKYVMGVWPWGGVGVCLIAALQHLAYCEKTNKVPVAYWGRDSLYYNPSGFNGEMNNVWEYYFEPLSPLKYSNGDKINNYVSSSYGTFHSQNLDQQELRDQTNKLWHKYIKPKANIQTKVDQFYKSEMQNKHIVGIHLRGTDITSFLNKINFKMKSIADTALKHATEDSIFYIMSDDLKLFDELCVLLKDRKVISYSCYRSDDGKPLHYKSKPSPAQVGEDVIVEMLLLAQCDYLVLMESNISAIPLAINNEVDFTFFWHDAALRI